MNAVADLDGIRSGLLVDVNQQPFLAIDASDLGAFFLAIDQRSDVANLNGRPFLLADHGVRELLQGRELTAASHE